MRRVETKCDGLGKDMEVSGMEVGAKMIDHLHSSSWDSSIVVAKRFRRLAGAHALQTKAQDLRSSGLSLC